MYRLRKNNDTYRVEDFSTDKYTLSTTKLYRAKETSGHKHDHDEVYYFVQGKGKLLLDNQTLEIIAGQFWYIQSGQFHKVINTGDDTLVFTCAWYNDGY